MFILENVENRGGGKALESERESGNLNMEMIKGGKCCFYEHVYLEGRKNEIKGEKTGKIC